MNNFTKNLLIWATISLVMVVLFNLFNQAPATQLKLNYSDFLVHVKAGDVVAVKIQGQKITGVMNDNKRFTSFSPTTTPWWTR